MLFGKVKYKTADGTEVRRAYRLELRYCDKRSLAPFTKLRDRTKQYGIHPAEFTIPDLLTLRLDHLAVTNSVFPHSNLPKAHPRLKMR